MKSTFLYVFGIFLLVFSFACKKDRLTTSGSDQLEFSADTLTFDTVFTGVGSTSLAFKVYNPHKKSIEISSIMLGGGQNSTFRLNIDGVATPNAENIQIAPKDSLYIFAEVTVDPTNVNAPFIHEDSVMFFTNGNLQQVKLVAWGQNAHYYGQTGFLSVIPCNDTWTNDKPHVIYGLAAVDSACTLTIEEGARVYVHASSSLYVYKEGTLIVNGTATNPVTFQQDRLEEFYSDIPGQWDGIWLSKGSINNNIEHLHIKNAIVGIRVDSLPLNSNPNLTIKNSIIENSNSNGILAITAVIDAENLLIYNTGSYAAQLEYGGIYNFRHCTFYNDGSQYLSHDKGSFRATNYFVDANQQGNIADLYLTVKNSIIYGSQEDEIVLDSITGSVYDVNFENCYIKSAEPKFNPYFINSQKNVDPQFFNANEDSLQLNMNSPCINAGLNLGVVTDVIGTVRDANPDIGAFEFQ